MEVWKRVGRAEYQVSNLGRVRSPRGVLKAYSHPLGYLLVAVRFNAGEKRTCVTVHRLVAEAFIGPRPAGLDVAHGDNDKTNNRAENLRYATRSENMADVFPGCRGDCSRCEVKLELGINWTHGRAKAGTNTCNTCMRASQKARRLRVKLARS